MTQKCLENGVSIPFIVIFKNRRHLLRGCMRVLYEAKRFVQVQQSMTL